MFLDLSRCHDWPVRKAMINLPIRMKGNSKCTSDNLLSPFGVQNMDIGAALQTLSTRVKLRLWHRLLSTQISQICDLNNKTVRTFYSVTLYVNTIQRGAVEPCFMDTCLIKAPHYCGEISSSLEKAFTFSLNSTHLIRTPINANNGNFFCEIIGIS